MPPKKARPSESTDNPADTSIVSHTTGADPKSPKPPKKSDKEPSKKKDDDTVALDDLLLPRSLISRLARGVLPPNTNLQKDAILAIAKSATVFISLLAAEANELTDRKTIQPGDVLKALKEIEFDTKPGFGAGERIERELHAFEESVKGKRKGYRDKVKARESAAGAGGVEGGEPGVDAEREGKRARLSVPGQEDGTGDTLMGDTTVDESRVTAGEEADSNEEQDQEQEQDSDSDDDEGDGEGEGDEEEDETQNPEDTLEMDDESSLLKNNVLAPDGRVEVEGSDDENE